LRYVFFNAAFTRLSELFRNLRLARRMDQFSGRQKLTTCRPRQWSVTPPIDWQLDRPPSTVGGHRQSSDNWQTLSRARGPTGSPTEVRPALYDLLIAAAIVTRIDRKYEFITDHVTPARWWPIVCPIMRSRLHYGPLVSPDVCPRKSAAMTGCCAAATSWNRENPGREIRGNYVAHMYIISRI